ncbi:CRISPR-associated helicase Cas3' [Trueperella bialowiezensis]|uniref:Helicase Cas3 n=1 Tax=Trueperella bialowiezensis TaxID=312285 RepID=A0A3S4WGM5_9ACTO|nr:CRISPR-associated helicase Cas3' [Trueperella bialowiezensis]VEI13474.1 helicase Cas3 [Trueperella bialowiezensis]
MDIAKQAEDWLNSLSPEAHSLWAKSGTEDAYLRLPQHLIDAACVAEWLWEHWVSDSLKRSLASTWKLSESDTKTLYIFYAGTHDVGKATVSFQRLVEHRENSSYLLQPIYDVGLSLDWPEDEGANTKFPHGTASAGFIKKWLRAQGVSMPVAARMASVADAHHGFTTDTCVLAHFEEVIEHRNTEFDTVAIEFIEAMAQITDIFSVLPNVPEITSDACQLMTGLLIMADWIASNEEAFPYDFIAPQPVRVKQGMSAVDLPPSWDPVAPLSNAQEFFTRTFDWDESATVRPIQQAAVEIARAATGPTLMIIEAPTGEGKTEAGLAAAHVLGEKSGAQGVFVAAPTMATANGLFERITEWARRSSKSGSVASMYLAHSKNRLYNQFQQLRRRPLGKQTAGQGSHSDQEENKGDLVANQWLSGSRRGMLSNFVVGTVDQVLMMVLKVRFSMLRHVALAGKVVIIDEVHAYDAYMSQYLYRALEWLARYGASVILMSATLPPQQRLALASAYRKQIPHDVDEPVCALDSSFYPLVSVVDGEGVRSVEVSPRPDDAQISVRRIADDLATLSELVGDLLTDGGIALVICNTIKRAQEAYRSLQVDFAGEIELHHSAFIASHRSAKEDALREKLGPTARRGKGRPLRQVIVATQVAEQSLDIDADVLITDIAPVDLIIQRAGRLHRHSRPVEDRPEKVRTPKMFIRGIEDDGEVPAFDRGAVHIYGKKLLLATMAHLPEAINRPSGVPQLVREVYSEEPDIPAAWQVQWEEACEKADAERSAKETRAKTFRFPSPSNAAELELLFDKIHNDSPDLNGEQGGSAQVRDSEFTIEVIAIQPTANGYRAFGSDSEVLNGVLPTYSQDLDLAGNSLRLPAWTTRSDTDFNSVIDSLEANTPGEWASSGLLSGQVALNFDESGIANLGKYRVEYDPEIGLAVSTDETR